MLLPAAPVDELVELELALLLMSPELVELGPVVAVDPCVPASVPKGVSSNSQPIANASSGASPQSFMEELKFMTLARS